MCEPHGICPLKWLNTLHARYIICYMVYADHFQLVPVVNNQFNTSLLNTLPGSVSKHYKFVYGLEIALHVDNRNMLCIILIQCGTGCLLFPLVRVYLLSSTIFIINLFR